MNTTNLSNADFKAGDNYAWPHSKVDGKLQPVPFQNLDNVGPAGSINSSSAEMAKWLLLQLNQGKYLDRDARLFSEHQSGEMWSPQTIIPTSERPGPLAALKHNFSSYGLGWFLQDYHGHKLVGHGGGVLGFVSQVMLVPDENLGVVILTDAEQGGALGSILYHILNQYLGLKPADWIAAYKASDEQEEKEAAETLKKQDASRAAESKPSLPLEKYSGVYADAWYGPVTIRVENAKLAFSLDHTPSAVADLQHWQYDTFKAHWRDHTIEDAFVTFALRSDGSIDHFTMVAVSPLADFSFDYQDLYLTPQRAGMAGKN